MNVELMSSHLPEEAGSESVELPPKKMRGTLAAVFVFSFFLFLYISFPFGVLKEYVAVLVSQNTGIQVRMSDLSPAFPVGIKVKDLEIVGNSNDDTIKIASLKLKIAILPLFAGKIGLSMLAESGKDGELDMYVSASIFDLIKNQPIPRSVEIKASDFPIGNAVAFGLGKVAAQQGASNPIVGELLENIVFKGDLAANVDFDIAVSDPINSSGSAVISLKQAKLSFANPNIAIPGQDFEIATIKATVKEGNIVVDKSSRFKSQGLDFTIDGRIGLRENFDKSTIDMSMVLRLDQELKKNYGFLLGPQEELNLDIRGFLSRAEFVKK